MMGTRKTRSRSWARFWTSRAVLVVMALLVGFVVLARSPALAPAMAQTAQTAPAAPAAPATPAKPEQPKAEQAKPAAKVGPKTEQPKPNAAKTDKPKPEQGKPEQGKPEQGKPDHRQRLPKGDHSSPPTRAVADDKPGAGKSAAKKPDSKKNAAAVNEDEDSDDEDENASVLPEGPAQPSDALPAEPVAKPRERVKKGVPPPTGLPVPRFVTLRAAEVNVRSGPGRSYPTEWIFTHKEMPVEITAEFDTWRRIRDWEGSTGWVHQSMLSGKRGVLIKGAMVSLRREPSESAAVAAYAKAGVMGKLLKCKDQWCYVELRGNRGWLTRKDVWGIYADEKIE